METKKQTRDPNILTVELKQKLILEIYEYHRDLCTQTLNFSTTEPYYIGASLKAGCRAH